MERVLKMDRPRGAGRFLSLTALWAEGCGGGFAIGHAYGVRVHRVQKVQKVQRMWWRLTPQILKKDLMRYGNCISISIIPGTRRQETSLRSPVK